MPQGLFSCPPHPPSSFGYHPPYTLRSPPVPADSRRRRAAWRGHRQGTGSRRRRGRHRKAVLVRTRCWWTCWSAQGMQRQAHMHAPRRSSLPQFSAARPLPFVVLSFQRRRRPLMVGAQVLTMLLSRFRALRSICVSPLTSLCPSPGRRGRASVASLPIHGMGSSANAYTTSSQPVPSNS